VFAAVEYKYLSFAIEVNPVPPPVTGTVPPAPIPKSVFICAFVL
jgi:hypothetical protein